MTITLQTNTSPEIQLDKTLTTVSTLTGTLRAETSLLDPVIIVTGSLSSLASVNYMTIPDFGRSYFVRGMRSIRDGLVEISGHVDVLSTYATEIRANRGITSRQERSWNLYLNDGSLRAYQNPNVIPMPFPSGFASARSYVLAVAGG